MEIIDNENTIVFRSIPENYYAELSGNKCNTVRVIPIEELDKYDIHYIEALRMFVTSNGVIREIIIVNTEEETGFGRSLTDVRPLNQGIENQYVFSWKPEKRESDDLLYISDA
ncbi:MAG TPA: hypothetical protein DCG34_01055 [Clostridiales bacterium]|nr:hypothetical protein [Clostridiales bacterium]